MTAIKITIIRGCLFIIIIQRARIKLLCKSINMHTNIFILITDNYNNNNNNSYDNNNKNYSH